LHHARPPSPDFDSLIIAFSSGVFGDGPNRVFETARSLSSGRASADEGCPQVEVIEIEHLILRSARAKRVSKDAEPQ